jgi:hypothetical protein
MVLFIETVDGDYVLEFVEGINRRYYTLNTDRVFKRNGRVLDQNEIPHLQTIYSELILIKRICEIYPKHLLDYIEKKRVNTYLQQLYRLDDSVT